MRILLILISLLSFGLNAWQVLLNGDFKELEANITHNFDNVNRIVTTTYPEESSGKTYRFSFLEEEWIVSVYKPQATCVYNKEVIGSSQIHLVLNGSTTGDVNSCRRFYFLLTN